MNTPDKLFTLLGSIVTVAIVSVILVNGKNASTLVTSLGNAFSGSLKTAGSAGK